MKKCTKCEESKELSEFTRNKQFSSGYTARCKECLKIDKKKWEDANPERVQELKKKSNAKRAKWAKKHKKEHARICREWKLKNPEKAKEHQQRCRLKKKMLKLAASVE